MARWLNEDETDPLSSSDRPRGQSLTVKTAGPRCQKREPAVWLQAGASRNLDSPTPGFDKWPKEHPSIL